jgi:5-methylcytosine-specific restriction endonuclease McrA
MAAPSRACDHAERNALRSALPCFRQHARRAQAQSTRVRKALLERYDNKCVYGRTFNDACRGRLTLDTLVVDHAVAFTKGGYDGPENWLPACESCNRKKAARTIRRLASVDGKWVFSNNTNTNTNTTPPPTRVRATPKGTVWHAQTGCARKTAVEITMADAKARKLRPCKVCV